MDPQEFFRQKRDALIKDFEKFRAEPYRDSKDSTISAAPQLPMVVLSL